MFTPLSSNHNQHIPEKKLIAIITFPNTKPLDVNDLFNSKAFNQFNSKLWNSL